MSRALRRRYGHAEGKLARDPYSTKSWTDGAGMHLQPARGGWIVEFRGEFMGSVKRLKSGWRIDGAAKGQEVIR